MDPRTRLLAVEMLLAEPETLGNDALETDLYIMRDQLRTAAATDTPDAAQYHRGAHGSPRHEVSAKFNVMP